MVKGFEGFEGFLSQVLNALAAMPLLSEFCQGDESSRLLWDFPEMFNLLIYILYELPTYFLRTEVLIPSYTILYLRFCNVLAQGSENCFSLHLSACPDVFSSTSLCSRDPVAYPADRRASQEIPRDKGHRTSPDDVYNISEYLYTWFGTTYFRVKHVYRWCIRYNYDYNTYRFFWQFDLSYAVRNKVSLLPTSAHARLRFSTISRYLKLSPWNLSCGFSFQNIIKTIFQNNKP